MHMHKVVLVDENVQSDSDWGGSGYDCWVGLTMSLSTIVLTLMEMALRAGWVRRMKASDKSLSRCRYCLSVYEDASELRGWVWS